MNTNMNINFENHESIEKTKKAVKIKIVIIFVLFFVLAFLVGVVVGNKVLAPDNKDNNLVDVDKENTDNNANKDNNVNDNNIINKDEEVKEEVLTINKEKAQEFLDDLGYSLICTYTNTENVLIPKEKRSLDNLLINTSDKVRFIYYLAERELGSEYKKYDESESGEEVSGAFALQYDAFKNYYKKVLGEEFKDELLATLPNTYVLKNNYLYGYIITGGSNNRELLAESFTKKGNSYTFVVVVKEFNDDEKLDETYRLKFELVKNNEDYNIKSVSVY